MLTIMLVSQKKEKCLKIGARTKYQRPNSTVFEIINRNCGICGHGRSGTITEAVYGKMKELCGKQVLEYINREWQRQRDLNKLRYRVRSLGSPRTDGQRLVVVLFLDGAPNDGLNYVFYENTDTFIYSNFYTDKKETGEYWYKIEQYFQAIKFRGVGPQRFLCWGGRRRDMVMLQSGLLIRRRT
jgi:hypothetical protein